MIFYVSCRPFRYRNQIVSPKQVLKNSFGGIKFSFECLGHNMKIDGRWLYRIEVNDEQDFETTMLEMQEIFIEALAPFAGHLKTLESAKALMEKISGRPYEIQKDVIVDIGPKVEI